MSVRATNSLIADLVSVSGLPNSPKMVVLSVNEEAKQVTTVWFSSAGESQSATFPAQSLDRVEVKQAAASPAKKKTSSSAGKGGKKK
ncbi:MAG: hypothetical protein LBD07_04580 [Spirochaetaceae bacterium]|jgi:hypothetical protein|nr:hypothetical protein [Spirochaetaceae bacterium]